MHRSRMIVLAATLLLIGAYAPLEAQQLAAPNESRTVIVQMVENGPMDFAFEPETITVHPGDVVRFTQTGQIPHNVEFKETPEDASLAEQRVGPFLTAQGQTYEIVIDEGFVAGEYRFICTPHVAMGMTGVITVAPATNP